MNLSCYIIDDEIHALEVLEDYVQRTPGLELAGKATNPLLALNELSSMPAPAFIFLDIDMPEMNGLEIAGMISPGSSIVFTTSFREYALDAFDKQASGYLLKPISYERFAGCIYKLRLSAPVLNAPRESCFFVQSDVRGKFVRINTGEISHIAGCLNYIEIYHSGQKTLTYLTMAEIMDKLPGNAFTRIHQSYIVAIASIKTIEPGQLCLNNGAKLPVGRAFRERFHARMSGELLISKRKKNS